MDAIGKRGMFRAVVFVLATIVASMAGGSGLSRAVAEPIGTGKDNCWMTGGGSIFDVDYGGCEADRLRSRFRLRNAHNHVIIRRTGRQIVSPEQLIQEQS